MSAADILNRLRNWQRAFGDDLLGIGADCGDAADEIERLRAALNDLLNDCINFDGGKLTDSIMAKASAVLRGG